VKALTLGSDLVLLDEPTASLTRSERASFFEWIRRLKRGGRTFVFISHFTSEVRELCTHFTVLRDGKVADSGTDPRSVTAADLSSRVTGSTIDEYHRVSRGSGEVLVQLRCFKAPGI